MQQILKQQSQSEQQIETGRELGDLFAEFLDAKGRLADLHSMKSRVLVSVDGELLHQVVNGVKQLLRLSDAEVMKMKIPQGQQVRFIPAVAGG